MNRRAFSLIELLLSIFILGLGMISIAALFPAGIVLQQRAEDELNGPLVAEHAMGVLRSRLSPSDFGTWWDSLRLRADLLDSQNPGEGQALMSQTRGSLAADSNGELAAWLRMSDWPWLRPSVVTNGMAGGGDLEGAVEFVFRTLLQHNASRKQRSNTDHAQTENKDGQEQFDK